MSLRVAEATRLTPEVSGFPQQPPQFNTAPRFGASQFPLPSPSPTTAFQRALSAFACPWPQVLKHSSSDVPVETDAAHSQRHKPSVRRPRWARLEAEGGKNENADHHLGTALLEQGSGTPVRQTHRLDFRSASNPLHPPDEAAAENHPALDARHQPGSARLIRLRRAYLTVRAVLSFGALRGTPAERVTENGNAGQRQGKAFPYYTAKKNPKMETSFDRYLQSERILYERCSSHWCRI